MEKELFCCLCDREYSELNLPRLFPACGHTYCENCIKNLMGLNKQREVRIICPQDHIEMRFEDRDINHFPKNISLVKLMAVSQSLRKKSNQTARDDPVSRDEELDGHTLYSQRNNNDNNKSQVNSSLSVKSKSVVSEDTLNEEQICLIHQKALEIVCIQHRTLICSNCAIFGQHKGHDFKSVRDMQKDKMEKEKGVLQLIDRKEAIVARELSKERRQEESRLVQLKKDLLVQELKLRYSKLYDLVKFAEKKSLQKVNKFFVGLEEKLKSENGEMQRVLSSYKEWEERAMKEVDSFERGNNLEEQIAFLGYEGTSQDVDVLEEGIEIIQDLEKQLKLNRNTFEETIEGVEIVVNDDIERGLSEYTCLRQKRAPGEKSCSPMTRKQEVPTISSSNSFQLPQSLPVVPSLREFRELLDLDLVTEKRSSQKLVLDGVQDPTAQQMLLQTTRTKNSTLTRTRSPEFSSQQYLPQLNYPQSPTNSFRHAKKPSNCQKILMPEPPPLLDRDPHHLKDCSKDSPNMKAGLRATFSSPRSRDFMMMGSALSGLDSPKKRLKVKLPEKYEKVLEALLFEATDTGDFTGAELGNQVVLQILEVLRGKKIKCLKFIRNKLTDDILDSIWGHLSNISVLNLSQNYFTDRAIESFIGNMSKVPHLKNLVLSQNKINARNTKARVEQLKRFDITISM